MVFFSVWQSSGSVYIHVVGTLSDFDDVLFARVAQFLCGLVCVQQAACVSQDQPYIYTYIHVYMCVCVCVKLAVSFV